MTNEKSFSEQPTNVKIISVAIIVLIFGFIAFKLYNANQQDLLENPTTLSGGKEYVDYKVKEIRASYDEICKGVRNDQVKEDLVGLHDDLRSLREVGFKIKEIGYDDQIKVNEYSLEKIKADKDLFELMSSGNCNCW